MTQLNNLKPWPGQVILYKSKYTPNLLAIVVEVSDSTFNILWMRQDATSKDWSTTYFQENFTRLFEVVD